MLLDLVQIFKREAEGGAGIQGCAGGDGAALEAARARGEAQDGIHILGPVSPAGQVALGLGAFELAHRVLNYMRLIFQILRKILDQRFKRTATISNRACIIELG